MLGLLKLHCSSLAVPLKRETRLQRLLHNHCFTLSIPPKPGRRRLRILLDEYCQKLQIPKKFYGDDWSDSDDDKWSNADSDTSTLVDSEYCPSLVSDVDWAAEGFTSARAGEETRAFQRRQGINEHRWFVVQPWTTNDVFN